MIAKANYNLILGITTDLKKTWYDLNPDSTGYEDEIHPRYIPSTNQTDWGKSYVFPDGSLVRNLERRQVINKRPTNALETLTFLEDSYWLEDGGKPFQVLGMDLECHAGGGLSPGNGAQIIRGLGMGGEVMEMINQYGFNITNDDIILHQVLLPYDD